MTSTTKSLDDLFASINGFFQTIKQHAESINPAINTTDTMLVDVPEQGDQSESPSIFGEFDFDSDTTKINQNPTDTLVVDMAVEIASAYMTSTSTKAIPYYQLPHVIDAISILAREYLKEHGYLTE